MKQPARANRPSALTIAGSDPSGGAGLQSDLKTFAALGVYGFSVITEIIAQNSKTVSRVEPVNAAMVTAQVEAVATERKPNAIKIGALGDASIVNSVSRCIVELKLAAPVVDPVLISSAGARLLDKAGEAALIEKLIPLCRVITPNLPEAQTLTRLEITDTHSMREAARRIVKLGARAVVIKGGHATGDKDATDLLFDGRTFVTLKSRRIEGDAHGTGCAFSAAIAAYLARGRDLDHAVRQAKRFVSAALDARFKFAKGRAMLDHFAAAASDRDRDGE